LSVAAARTISRRVECPNAALVGPGPRDGPAQRLKKGGGIGIAIGTRLRERHHRLVVGLFRSDQRQVTYRSEFQLMMRHAQALLRGLLRAARRVQRIRVGIERMQGIRYILKCGQHRGAILGCRLIESRIGRTLAMHERASGK